MKRRIPLKRTGFKKKKRKPLRKAAKTLKNKLWRIVSEVVRRRDADADGIASCVSCGARKHWKELQCGHYVPASAGMATYFDPRNLNPQCVSCNVFRNGNLTQYTLYMIEKHGQEVLHELDALRRTNLKISAAGYEELIERWEAMLAALDASQKAAA